METDEQLLNPNIWRTKTIKRYYKSTPIMDVLVICRDALCSKEINKEKLDLTSEFWIFFTFQQGLTPSWQHVSYQFLCQMNLTEVNHRLIDLDRDSKILLGFSEEKLNSLMYIQFGHLWKFSDQVQNCPV